MKFVDVGEADYRIGLERNQYDVVWIFDGWDGIRLTQIDKVSLASLPLIDHDDCIPDWYTPLLASSDRMAEKRPADLAVLLAATSRGYQAAMEDPTAAVDALMKASPDLDRNLVTRSAAFLATRYADRPSQWGQQSDQVWSSFSAFLTKAGLVDKPIDVTEVWTNEFLRSAERSPMQPVERPAIEGGALIVVGRGTRRFRCDRSGRLPSERCSGLVRFHRRPERVRQEHLVAGVGRARTRCRAGPDRWGRRGRIGRILRGSRSATTCCPGDGCWPTRLSALRSVASHGSMPKPGLDPSSNGSAWAAMNGHGRPNSRVGCVSGSLGAADLLDRCSGSAAR